MNKQMLMRFSLIALLLIAIAPLVNQVSGQGNSVGLKRINLTRPQTKYAPNQVLAKFLPTDK
jgi:hypothetical protein